jgi:hypothetical protein
MSTYNRYSRGTCEVPRHPQPYIRPKVGGGDWYRTSTTVWPCDETIKGRAAEWRRLLGENGRSGFSGQYRDHSVLPAPLCEWIIIRYLDKTDGLILDAFAGGPTEAAVSALMEHTYLGYEIRKELIDKNIEVLTGLSLIDRVTYRCSDGTLLVLLDHKFHLWLLRTRRMQCGHR